MAFFLGHKFDPIKCANIWHNIQVFVLGKIKSNGFKVMQKLFYLTYSNSIYSWLSIWLFLTCFSLDLLTYLDNFISLWKNFKYFFLYNSIEYIMVTVQYFLIVFEKVFFSLLSLYFCKIEDLIDIFFSSE